MKSRHVAMVGLILLASSGTTSAGILSGGVPDTNFPGLKVWYDAATIGVGDGNPVSAWSNSAPTANTATNGVSGRDPSWVASGVNGLPAVQFDGVDDQLIMGVNLFSGQNSTLTYFALIQSTDTAAHIIGYGSSSAGYLTSYGAGLIINGTPGVKANSANNGVFTTAPGEHPDTVAVAAVASNASSKIYLNGLLHNTDHQGLVTPYNYSRATLGASDGSASGQARDPFDGSISEILVYGALTASEIDEVNGYLTNKYALTSEPLFVGDEPNPDYSKLRVWYDAGSIGVGVGNPVTAWTNSAAETNTATVQTGGREPVWTNAGINNLPAVIFDGVDDQLVIPNNIFAVNSLPLSYFAVIQSTDTTAHLIGSGSSSPGYRTSLGAGLLIDESAVAVKAISGGSSLFLPALTTDYTNGALVTAIACDYASSIGTGGLVESTDVVSVLRNGGYAVAGLGAATGNGGGTARDPFDGSVSEILVYGYLTATEIAEIETYLLDKYFPPPPPPAPAGTIVIVR